VDNRKVTKQLEHQVDNNKVVDKDNNRKVIKQEILLLILVNK
jgi:hypothetical protein